VRRKGELMLEALLELSGVRTARGRGLMLGIDLASELSAPEVARRALLEQRLVVNATGPETIRLEPPLVVTDAQLHEALRRLEAVLG
jgi:acetylornithine/succinyldiaminopimelate/putrescine aminotransferase